MQNILIQLKKRLPLFLVAIAITGFGVARWVKKNYSANTVSKQNGNTTSAFDRLPLVFEPNVGQFPDSVGFLTRGKGYQAFLATHTPELQIRQKDAQNALRLRFKKARPVAPQGVGKLPGQSNYLIGRDPNRWQTGVSHFEKVSYSGVYPGVDLFFYGNEGQLEYDFVIAPFADPNAIRLSFSNAEAINVNEDGGLSVKHKEGELRQRKPLAYQNIDGTKRIVESRFELTDHGEISFTLGTYDREHTLVIDPAISYSALFGGSSNDAGQSIVVDAAGNTYIAGITNSEDFQTTPGAYRAAILGGEAFIVKINPSGTNLLYATYLGGSASDRALDLAVDSAGNTYITGSTTSPDFPLTTGALRTTFSGGEAFVTKLNSTGSSLLYSTYLGGSNNEIAYGLALDGNNNVYVTGLTSSSNFPTTPNAVKNNISGVTDVFVAKVNSTATALDYSTYLGGGSSDSGYSIAVDNTGSAYVAGNTSSSDFPASASAYQRNFGGSMGLSDAFVAKLNNTGTALIYATYLGGNETDSAYGIAVDTAGNAYVTGETAPAANGANYPVTAGALQTSLASGGQPPGDAFVTKINPSGSTLVYSTYFGGNGTDKGQGIALDSANNVYVTGLTASTNLTAVGGGLGVYGDNFDAFVLGLNSAGGALTYYSYLGGGSNDSGAAIALSNTGEIYVTGSTVSTAFPVTPGTLRPRATNRTQEAFVTRIGASGATPLTSVSAASYSGPQLAEESIVAAFGTRLATQTAVGNDTDPGTPGIQLPTTLAGTQLFLRDNAGVERAVPLFFVSPLQINYQIPPGVAAGTALVTVRSSDGSLALGNVQVVKVSPGIFTFNGTGQGVPAGYAIRVRADNSQNIETIGELDAQNRWVTRPLDLGPNADRVFLVLFGTGWRFRDDGGVTVQIGSVTSQVEFAGAQGNLVGLDQVNILVPRSLAGRGRVNLTLTANSLPANPVALEFR